MLEERRLAQATINKIELLEKSAVDKALAKTGVDGALV